MSSPQKAYFTVVKVEKNSKPSATGTKIEVQFNPETYGLSKSSDWSKTDGEHKYDVPLTEWKGGGSMKLEMTLFFDTYESGDDVRDKTSELEDLCLVDGESHEPPKLTFTWGGSMTVKGSHEIVWVLSSFNTTYKMFNGEGVPVRAEMKVSLTEFATEKMLTDRSKMQSPDHEKAYRVQPGDTLQSIAYSHYDDAALWRPIASANNIEDPRSVAPGTVLRVPRIR